MKKIIPSFLYTYVKATSLTNLLDIARSHLGGISILYIYIVMQFEKKHFCFFRKKLFFMTKKT